MLCLGSAVADFHGVDPNTLSCDPTGQTFLLLPHFTNCSRFFICAHGQEVEMSCAGGTIFDFPIQSCNHVWATECYLRDVIDVEIESGSGEEEFTDISSNTESFVPIVKKLAEVQPANTLLNCNDINVASRRFSYNGDCQRYWRCVEGVAIAQYCSDGLFFNEYKQQCDFEANVKCEDQIDDELSTEFIVYK
ncbi:unnamed protein product [Colias eurytheme]|nr:unnamed protein product [Colias eurytheme]